MTAKEILNPKVFYSNNGWNEGPHFHEIIRQKCYYSEYSHTIIRV